MCRWSCGWVCLMFLFQYIQQNIRSDCSNIDKILEPPEGQDEGVWKYEHLRWDASCFRTFRRCFHKWALPWGCVLFVSYVRLVHSISVVVSHPINPHVHLWSHDFMSGLVSVPLASAGNGVQWSVQRSQRICLHCNFRKCNACDCIGCVRAYVRCVSAAAQYFFQNKSVASSCLLPLEILFSCTSSPSGTLDGCFQLKQQNLSRLISNNIFRGQSL